MSNLLTEKETWIDKLVDELVDTKDEIADNAVEINQFYTLVKLILNNSRLDYDGKELRFDSESAIFEYLKVIDPDAYYRKFNSLKTEREAEIAKRKETREAKED